MGNESLFAGALLLERQGRFEEALERFRECLADPTFDEGDLHFHCGWCLENNGQNVEALQLYARAAEATHLPSCKLNSLFRSGWILMHAKDFMKATDMFRCAIDYGDLVEAKDETYKQSLYWYAVCLEVQGRYIDALTWYRVAQGASIDLDPESRLRQVKCLVRIGMYDDALNICCTFDAPCPEEFDAARYEILCAEISKERRMLQLSLEPLETHTPVFAHAHR